MKLTLLLAASCALLALAGVAAATTDEDSIDLTFSWAACPDQDSDGNPLAPAVRYNIYASRNSGAEYYLCQVAGDTICTEEFDRGVHYRLRIVGYDDQGRASPPSEWSEDIYYESGMTPVGDLPATGAELRATYPNPFNPAIWIRFAVSAAASSKGVHIDILDVRGRVVRTLVSGPWPAGEHEVQWNGTDDTGRSAASGTYLLRMRADGQQQLRSITLVK